MLGCCVTSAVMALHPSTCSISVVFFFPDRHCGFNGVYDGSAGAECSLSVSCTDYDADSDFPNF